MINKSSYTNRGGEWMKVVSLHHPHTLTKETQPESVAAIGFFDGVHLGHQTVIRKAVDIAKKQNIYSSVMFFDPHPSVVLQKDKTDVQYITPLDHKIALMEQLGVDILYIVRFDKELSKLLPNQFLDQFIDRLNIVHIVAGFDFTFGHKGAGNMNNISDYLPKNIRYDVISKQDQENEKISSTRIRECLAHGDLQEVERLLGRPYETVGEVVHGDKRGREIGYPTANINQNNDYIIPKIGIYAVEVKVNEELYKGMASIGYNPTFKDDKNIIRIEVNLFEFQDDIYGKPIHVYWKKYMRDEVKFTSVDALIEQLEEDERQTREFFKI